MRTAIKELEQVSNGSVGSSALTRVIIAIAKWGQFNI